MTQQFVKCAQESLATWNWCKNSAFFNKPRANQNHETNPLNFRLLPHCVATFWNFPEPSCRPQDRAICANQKHPLLLTQWILCTYTQPRRPFLLSRQGLHLLEHLHVQPHTNIANCMCTGLLNGTSKSFNKRKLWSWTRQSKETKQICSVALRWRGYGERGACRLLRCWALMTLWWRQVKWNLTRVTLARDSEIEINNIIPGKKG